MVTGCPAEGLLPLASERMEIVTPTELVRIERFENRLVGYGHK